VGDIDDERLRRLLGDPSLEWLLERVRRRIELGRPLLGTATRRNASAAERDAVERLFGRRPHCGRALGVPLADLDELLRGSGLHAEGLAAAVIALTGPVSSRADTRARDQDAWRAAFAGVVRATAGRPELARWLQRIRDSGLVKRLEPDPARAGELLDVLVAVLDALPAAGESLSAFSARVAGRSHALDDGEPLATLALGAARALSGIEAPGPEESAAEARREAWAAVGVLCDELSSAVLTLGLAGDRSSTGQILALGRSSGQPLWLTLRQLVRDPPRWATGSLPERARVYVCENPSIVALAADRLGADCPPLVCTNGQPGAATMLLLRSLVDAGAELLHHGDFDWGGVRIGNVLHRRLPIVAWQFDRDAYLRAVAACRNASSLAGEPVVASWDPHLGYAMGCEGRRIEEELVADDLLRVLEADAGRPAADREF
jgi:uncharacterized protein (TIGR02679 family)